MISYFGKYNLGTIKYALDCVERRIIKWVMCKFKRFRIHARMTEKLLVEVRKRESSLFIH